MKKIRMLDFMIHFKTDEHTLYFEVYPVIDWLKPFTNEEGTSYTDVNGDAIDSFEKGAFKVLEGSFCWRGVWEGRLYFPADEYWGEDIQELSELYNNHIVIWCKEFIKNREPETQYED